MRLLPFLLFLGVPVAALADEARDVLAKRSCPSAKVHEDGTLELDTDFYYLGDQCREFLEAKAHFYETVLLKGNHVSKDKDKQCLRPFSSVLLGKFA
jgi:hypothetical protein